MKDSKTKASSFPTPAAEAGDVEQRIRERAFLLYLERGMAPGRELEDWLQAEQEVAPSRASSATPKAAA
jgi:hypothetical protein